MSEGVVVGAEFSECFATDPTLRVITTRDAFGVQPPESLAMAASDGGFCSRAPGPPGSGRVSRSPILRACDKWTTTHRPSTSVDRLLVAALSRHGADRLLDVAIPDRHAVARPSMLTRAIRNFRPTLCWLPRFAFLRHGNVLPQQTEDAIIGYNGAGEKAGCWKAPRQFVARMPLRHRDPIASKLLLYLAPFCHVAVACGEFLIGLLNIGGPFP